MIALVNLARSHAFSHSCSATGYKQHRKRKSTCNRRSRSETVTGAFTMLCAFMPLANTVEKQNKTFIMLRNGVKSLSCGLSLSTLLLIAIKRICFLGNRISVKSNIQSFLQLRAGGLFVLVEGVGVNVQRGGGLTVAEDARYRGHIRTARDHQTGGGKAITIFLGK